MGNQDFLISFSVDGTNAIRMMEQIGQRATALEARLNALGRGSGGAGTMGGNILTNLGLGPAQVGASTRAMSGLEASVARMSSARQAGSALGFSPSAGALKTEAVATQQLAQNYGALATSYGVTSAAGRSAANQSAYFSAQARTLAADSKIAANQLDDTGQAFGRHTRRIFEAILIYEAFGRAVQAVQSGIALIIDIDRESRRLEAVLEINPTQGAQFVQDLGKIASETITPWEGLVSETDRMAAAFLDVEDPIKRVADTLLFAENAGKFTTVTQRDLGTEVTNLIAIMKQLNIPVEDLDDFLGKIVVAGGNASSVIAGLSDSLQISSRAAKAAGVDLDLLLAAESAFLIKTGRTGSEVGNTFTIFFQRLRDPDVINSVDEITNGLLKMRDAAGAIRDPFQILLELDALRAKGLITQTQKVDVLAALAPPLQPQRQFDFELILDQLKELGPRFKEVSEAGGSALTELNDKINAALGKQFEKLITDAQRAFVDLFGPGFLSMGQQFIDVIRAIGDALKAVPPEVLTGVIGFASLMVAFKLLAFAGKGIVTLLGMGGLQGTFIKLGGAAVTTSTSLAAAGTTFKWFGAAAFTAGGLIAGLTKQLMILLPLIATWMAIDFAGKVGEMKAGLKGQVGSQMVGKDLEELKALRAKIQAQMDADKGPSIAGGNNLTQLFGAAAGAIGSAFANDALAESLAETDKQIVLLEQAGPGAVVAINSLGEAFVVTDDAADDAAETVGGAIGAFGQMQQAALASADALTALTGAERINAEAIANTASLTDEISASLSTLLERYRDGAISAKEYADGQGQVGQASTLAGQLVAAAGDQLAKMPLLAAAAAKGTDELTATIFELILGASNSLPVIDAAIQRILGIAAATAAASNIVARNPIVVRTIILAPAKGGTLAGGGFFEGADKTGSSARNLTISGGGASTSTTASTAAIMSQLTNLFKTLTTGSSTAFGTTFGGTPKVAAAAAAAPAPNLFDIGDLPVDQLALAIAKAQALQASIPGANAAAKDSILNIIKDADFLRQVKGLDDELLRKVLQELIDVEKARLDLEKQQSAMLSNLQINQGGFGALVTQPSMFGAGGSFAGTGLNFDPNSGGITINVGDITAMTALTPQQLYQQIYGAITKALADAQRT